MMTYKNLLGIQVCHPFLKILVFQKLHVFHYSHRLRVFLEDQAVPDAPVESIIFTLHMTRERWFQHGIKMTLPKFHIRIIFFLTIKIKERNCIWNGMKKKGMKLWSAHYLFITKQHFDYLFFIFVNKWMSLKKNHLIRAKNKWDLF